MKALKDFGAPTIPEEEFFGNEFDVWGLGREPNRIEILSEVKGLKFHIAYKNSHIHQQENTQIRSPGFKDKNDIEQLSK